MYWDLSPKMIESTIIQEVIGKNSSNIQCNKKTTFSEDFSDIAERNFMRLKLKVDTDTYYGN